MRTEIHPDLEISPAGSGRAGAPIEPRAARRRRRCRAERPAVQMRRGLGDGCVLPSRRTIPDRPWPHLHLRTVGDQPDSNLHPTVCGRSRTVIRPMSYFTRAGAGFAGRQCRSERPPGSDRAWRSAGNQNVRQGWWTSSRPTSRVPQRNPRRRAWSTAWVRLVAPNLPRMLLR